jgi:hypothetical protein
MNRISAAGNLTIQVDPGQWRLIANGNFQERVLLEAASNQPIKYIPAFANKRRLPDSGEIALAHIQRVVLGWSQQDESWHLGLLLGPEIATDRGSRWLELASWPDAETTVFRELAKDAGQQLGLVLARPFSLIEPQLKEPEPEPLPPLRPLPLEFDDWTLVEEGTLRFNRAPGWKAPGTRRVIWYSLLTLIYVVLSVVTLLRPIALPKPEWLPYLGLAVAAVLLGLVIYTIYRLLTDYDHVVLDDSLRSIVGRRGETERWRVDNVAIVSLYISEVVKMKGQKRNVLHGEINAQLQDGSFRNMLTQYQPTEDTHTPPDNEIVDGITPLTARNAATDLQHAGLWISQALGVPSYLDIRRR